MTPQNENNPTTPAEQDLQPQPQQQDGTSCGDNRSTTTVVVDGVGWWGRCTRRYLKQPIVYGLLRTAKFTVTYPKLMIAACIILSFSIAVIGVMTNFRIENEGSILWTPTNCATVVHGDWLSSPESGFPQATREMKIILHATNPNTNILGVTGVTKLFQVVDTIRTTPGYHELCALSRDNMPTTTAGKVECPITSPTGFWNNHNSSVFHETMSQLRLEPAQDVFVKHVLSQYQYHDKQVVDRNVIYGHPLPHIPTTVSMSNLISTSSSNEYQLESISAYMATIQLPPIMKEALPFEAEIQNRLFAIQNEWHQEAEETNDDDITYVLEYLTERSFDDELMRGISEDIKYMVMAFIIMGIFCAMVLGKQECFTAKDHRDNRSAITSQSIVGLGAVSTIILALITGYGLMFWIGVPFTSLTQIFPYVMVGIGLDDTFIITGALQRYNDKGSSIQERIESVVQDIGISITVSTITTFVAFMLGSISSLPGMRWFAYYAGPTVLIDFVYQMTFFIAILALDDQRQSKNRRDCCPCCIVNIIEDDEDEESEDNDMNDKDDKVHNDTDDDDNHLNTGTTCTNNPNHNRVAAEDETRYGGGGTTSATIDDGPTEEVTLSASSFSTKLMDAYCNILFKPVTKIIVVLVSIVLVVLGAVFSSQQSQEFDWRDLVPEDSYVRSFFKTLDIHIGQQGNNLYVSHCYFRNIDISQDVNQQYMNEFVNDMIYDMDYIGNPPINFWLHDFQQFQNITMTTTNSSSSVLEMTATNFQDLSFYEQLDIFLSTEPYSELYKHDVVWNDINDKSLGVKVSRTILVYDQVSPYDNEEQIDALKEELRIAKQQVLNRPHRNNPGKWYMFSFGEIYYAWELYNAIFYEILTTVSLGLAAVFMIALVFLPKPPFGAILVTIVVAAIYIELLGLLYVANIYVNSISAVGLTMSIGLVVDYNMHIILTYFEVSPGGNSITRQERVRKVLHTMGKSILLGGLSTFLGVLPLSFSTSEIFRTFFITFIGIVVFGAGHGLIFLPVVLSMIAPNPQQAAAVAAAAAAPVATDTTTTRTTNHQLTTPQLRTKKLGQQQQEEDAVIHA